MLKQKEYSGVYSEETGTLEGYASTWIRKPDAYGDVVREGAFAKCLEKLKAEGKKIPLIWSHQLDNLRSYIGECEAYEDEKGLHFIATFNDSDEAQKVRELYKKGLLSKFSFAYNIIDEGPVVLENGVKANELRELEIYEISCVLVPANPDAGVIEVKISKTNKEEIKKAITLLQKYVDGLETSEETCAEKCSNGNAPEAEDQQKLNERKAALLDRINKIKI